MISVFDDIIVCRFCVLVVTSVVCSIMKELGLRGWLKRLETFIIILITLESMRT